jgi:hypothetical protein
VLPLEVQRVLSRRQAQHGGEAFDSRRQTHLADLVGDDLAALRQLADELLIARVVAAAADVAEGPPDPAFCQQMAGEFGDGE